ncbi:hypothetical protein [uncultured Campylobacter sp.]|uniref:hypothetical protein n=1 Tax=uncultured Campylobacter sp. TaxID=218934 RepID=UPI00262E9E7A|nr:hypothetical protein [uncultured Campylobacter sp.]
MAKALKIIIAVVTGYFFIIVVLPILIILTIFLLFEFFSVDKDAMELKKAPLMQNYEQNREKFLDLLAFAGRNFPKNSRVMIESAYDDEYIWIYMDGNKTKFYSNSIFKDNAPSIGEGLKLIGWDKKTFAELKSKLAAINARTIVLNRSGDNRVPWASITYSYMEHFADSYEFYVLNSPKLAELYAKGCSRKFQSDGVVFLYAIEISDYRVLCKSDDDNKSVLIKESDR